MIQVRDIWMTSVKNQNYQWMQIVLCTFCYKTDLFSWRMGHTKRIEGIWTFGSWSMSLEFRALVVWRLTSLASWLYKVCGVPNCCMLNKFVCRCLVIFAWGECIFAWGECGEPQFLNLCHHMSSCNNFKSSEKINSFFMEHFSSLSAWLSTLERTHFIEKAK